MICMLIMTMVSCKKEPTPAPTPSGPTVTCQSSTWTYKVEFGTPVVAGMFDIIYLDAYGNSIHDTTATGSQWSIDISPASTTPIFSVNVVPGPHFFAYISPGTNLTNTVKVSILRDGVATQTTGTFLNFCQTNGPSCSVGTVNSITRNDSCN